MATSTVSMTNNLSTDGAFQTFNSAINTAILAMGWVASSDTGQMNPATQVRTGISTSAGYIIYRMDDALQATCPVFLKILFGQGGTATMYRLIIQVANSTNGAGTLTGNISTAWTFTSTGTTAALNCYFSGTTARLQIALFPSTTTAQMMLSIERDKDANGADQNLGFHIINYGIGNVWNQQYIPAVAYGPPCVAEAKACTLISSQASQGSGGSTGVGVIRPVAGAMRNPGIGMLIVSRADWTTEVTNSVTIYSTARTYIALTTATAMSATSVANNAAVGSFLLFE
jgi:hypothetical protein